MIAIRRADERGHANHGWLDSSHTFSFAGYYDPAHMGFSDLRVINEDRVKPGRGFGTHGHRDMEILSYVLGGALEHRDSMGTGSVMRPGDVQLMSAGSGVLHSEYNHSQHEGVHFLQIWILPESGGGPPRYQQQRFEEEDKRGRLRLVVSPDGDDGSLQIKQDARVYAGIFQAGDRAEHSLLRPDGARRRAWVQVARGGVTVDGHVLAAGDGLALDGPERVVVDGVEGGGEVLLFDLR